MPDTIDIPKYYCPDQDIERGVWVNPVDSVWNPLQAILDSNRSEEAVLEAMSTVIDRCEWANVPARMAILLCDPQWRFIIDSLASRYNISGADMREDRFYSPMRREKRPPNHWMNNMDIYVKGRVDSRPLLASPVRR